MPIAFRSSGEDPRVSAKRLSAPVTHQRLVLNKAGFWPAQAPSRTALLAAVLLGMAGIGAGCSSDSPVSALVKDDDSSDSRELPQGVIAPYQPVQPGDARLGADGHYDYTAEDFVLRHPCDDQELMAKLKEKGWEKAEEASARTDNPFVKGCVLLPDDSTALPIAVHAQKRSSIAAAKDGDFVESIPKEGMNYYVSIVPGAASNMCFVGQDTSYGALGLAYLSTQDDTTTTRQETCKYVENKYVEAFQGE